MPVTTVSPKVHQLYSNLSMVEACELHERLNQGKTDLETRRRLAQHSGNPGCTARRSGGSWDDGAPAATPALSEADCTVCSG